MIPPPPRKPIANLMLSPHVSSQPRAHLRPKSAFGAIATKTGLCLNERFDKPQIPDLLRTQGWAVRSYPKLCGLSVRSSVSGEDAVYYIIQTLIDVLSPFVGPKPLHRASNSFAKGNDGCKFRHKLLDFAVVENYAPGLIPE